MRGMHIADCSPLHLACFLPSGRVVLELLEGKSNIAMPMATYSPLHVAAAFNNIGPVKELLNFGANPNVEDGMGNTPLHLAAFHGGNDVVGPLIKGLFGGGGGGGGGVCCCCWLLLVVGCGVKIIIAFFDC